MDRLHSFWLMDGETLYEPAELLLGEFHQIFRSVWPLIPAIFQSLIQQQESSLIPQESLDPVFPSATEQKEGGLMGIQTETGSHQSGQAVDGFPHIRISTGQVDMVGSDVAD